MRPRTVTAADMRELIDAKHDAILARDRLKKAGATQAAKAVSRTLKSIDGAIRHAQRCAPPMCGCYAGILIANGSEIQRCDECDILIDDSEAIAMVERMLGILRRDWNTRGGTPNEAYGRLNVESALAAQRGRVS